MPTLQLQENGANHAARVDPVMGVEILVFGRKKRLLDHWRNGAGRQEQAALIGDFGKQTAIACVNAAHYRRLVIFQLGKIRQILFKLPDHQCDHRRAKHEQDCAGRKQKSKKPGDHSHLEVPCKKFHVAGFKGQ